MSLVIYRCGCSTTMNIPEGMTKASIQFQGPAMEDAQRPIFNLQLTRISVNPSMYVEDVQERPLWSDDYHMLVPFDIRLVPGVNLLCFEDVFSKYWVQCNGHLPQCWIPDIMRGSGRFFGIWAHQTPASGRRVQHLTLLDGGAPSSAD